MSFPPLSILDLAMVTQGHSAADAFANSAGLAQAAERMGYNRFWLAEHHNMEGVASSATSVLMGHVAQATKTIRIGSGGIMLPNHAPLVVAEQFGTLATLFPGRIDLGLGRAPGTDQLTAMALRRDQRAVMDFEGNIRELMRYLSAQNNTGAVRAIPGEGLDIPIWILGSSTDSAYLAAQMGLPYAFASHFAPAHLMDASAIYRKNFKPSEHLDRPYFMPCINVIAAATNEEAQYLATSFKLLFLGILTGRRLKMPPPVDPTDFMDPLEEAALQQMIRYSFVGAPETVKRELTAFIEATAADEIMISTPVYDHKKRVESYGLVRAVV